MFKTKNSNTKKSEDVKKSAGKVLDTKKDTPTRAKVMQILFSSISQSQDDWKLRKLIVHEVPVF